MSLRRLLEDHRIPQREVAEAIGRSDALVSRLVSGEARPNKDSIDGILAFLSDRLGRRVTYEETFGDPAPIPDLADRVGGPA